MARIKITDLDPEISISKEEMKKVMGGLLSPIGAKGTKRATLPISMARIESLYNLRL